MQSANGILTLPSIAAGGVGTITIQARVSGSNGGFSVEQNVNGAGWITLQTFTSSSTTATQFQLVVNDGRANQQLRIVNTGGSGGRALYVHDLVVTGPPTSIGYANLQFPPTATITEGQNFTAYARVYEAGVTEAAGASPQISAWIGYSTTNSDPSTWTNWVPATYNVQAGNDDEYQATFGAAFAPGIYYFASRFQRNGGTYYYGGYNVSGGGFWNGTSNVSGVLTINALPKTLLFYNLQFPASATITQGSSVEIFAQAYEPGVTEAPGATPGLQAWIGYSSINENPNSASFTWVPAVFNTQSGNNDEFKASIGSSLAPGTYYFASRFQLNGGDFYYGGLGGAWNGTSSVNGVLTVNPPPTTIQYANLQFPPSAIITQGGSITAFARVFVAGVTEPAGSSPQISAWIGYSSTNSNPSTWTNWVPATFNVQAGNDDEYQATFGSSLTPGTYYFASRFQRNGGDFYYGGYSAGGGNFWDGTNHVSGVLTVECPVIAPPSITAGGPTTICPGASVVLTSSQPSGNIWSTGATSQSITVSAGGSYSVQYTNADGCTSAFSASTVVTVEDVLPPTVVTKNIVSLPLAANGTATITLAQVFVSGTDNCGTVTPVSVSPNSFTCDDVVKGTVADLFISEYIEGSGNNKAIEIYNGTGAAIDLGAGGYNIQMFFNGNTSAGLTINLVGIIPSGGVFVVAQASANAAILAKANQVNSSNWYNGDDAVVLRKGSAILDVIGQIGFDPGTEWGSGLTSTADNTIRRKANIIKGDTNGADVFNPADEWEGFPNDDFSGLGSHGIGTPVTLTVTDGNGNNATAVAYVNVEDNIAPTVVTKNITVQLNASGTATISAADVNDGSSDACGIETLSLNKTSFDCSNLGENTVTLTVTDKNGNSASANATVIVEDVTPPVLTPADDQNVNLDAGCEITVPDVRGTATDNCAGTVITQLPAAGTKVSAAHNGTISVTVTATDAAGNTDVKTVVLTAKDVTAPVLTPADDQNVNLDAGCEITVPDVRGTATDNCAGTVITQLPAAGTKVSAVHNGTINVTVTATDAAGNTDVKTVVLTAKDVTPPSITCPPSQTFASDAGTETKTLTAAQIGTPTVNDNCGATFSWSRSDGAASLTAPFNFGTTTITWTATDAAGNSTSCTQTISVDQVTTETTVSVSPVTAQYSDRVSFTATVSPFNVSGAGAVGGTVTFRIGTQVMGTAPVINGTATLANVALLETAPAGQLAPGNRQVTATFAGTNPNYIVNNPAAATLVITQEDARVEYIGMESQATPSVSSSTATVQLTATVADITAITGDPAFDAFAGDIRNARVRFVNRDNNSAISGWLTPSLINGDTKVGVVNFAWPVNIGSSDAQSFTVGIEVEGYYTRNDAEDNVVITVYKPIGDFVAGGGYIRVTNSAGSLAATGGTKMNFGLNVKFNKKGTNLQGGVNMIFRRNVNGTIRTYQIRSNSMISLGVSGTTNDRIAQFLSKANLTDVTNPLAPVSLGGNLDLRVSLRDRGEPGVNDEIGVTLMNNSGTLLFSSNWSTTATVRTVLGGGNIYINSANFGSTAGAREADPAAHMPAFNANCFDVQVLGNPTQHQFGLRVISSDVNSKITVRITDVNGRVVEVQQNLYSGQLLQLGGNYAPGVYFAEAIQGTERKVLRLVKLN